MSEITQQSGNTMPNETIETTDMTGAGLHSQLENGTDDSQVFHIVFVCTGNTCRSPMARCIAERLVSEHKSKIQRSVWVDSCGVAASDGSPASLQAVEVMNERQLDISTHKSKQISREIIDRAHVLYTMTPSHYHALVHQFPDAHEKVQLLDPNQPVGDPYGGPVEIYRLVADQLETLIAQRLKELAL